MLIANFCYTADNQRQSNLFFRAKKKNFCNEYYVIASYHFTLFVYFLVFVLMCKIVVYL